MSERLLQLDWTMAAPAAALMAALSRLHSPQWPIASERGILRAR